MTIIRTTCPTCGTISVSDDQMFLEDELSPPSVGSPAFCVFQCPRCAQRVRRQIDRLTAESLLRAGVRVERNATRPGHPEDPPVGSPFTWDDVLDLHLLLEEDGWFDRCLALVR